MQYGAFSQWVELLAVDYFSSSQVLPTNEGTRFVTSNHSHIKTQASLLNVEPLHPAQPTIYHNFLSKMGAIAQAFDLNTSISKYMR